MINNTQLKKCTACMACANVCPKKCISFVENEFGFLYPKIDSSLCIECDICKLICPINKVFFKDDKKEAYLLIDKREDKIVEATSGGAFGLIAESVLGNRGVVYGCAFNDDLKAQHIRVTNKEDLIYLKGSKYVQSNIGNVFKFAKEDLDTGTDVLFTGTPCQIAGLYSYLNKDYKNLYTIDLICHGVPSQAYFDKYIEYLSAKYDCKIININFRDKSNHGWSLAGTFTYLKKNRTIKRKLYYFNSYYYYYFLEGKTYRDSCYNCQYASEKRVGDITIGDFWGAEEYADYCKIKNGASLVIENSEKGKKILDSINAEVINVDFNKAKLYNKQLIISSILPVDRRMILEQFVLFSGKRIQKLFVKKNIIILIKSKIKYMIPEKIIHILLSKRVIKHAK